MKNVLTHGWRLIRIAILIGLIFVTFVVIWASTLQLPTLDNFDERRELQSTKIYDRTGEIVLFDFNQDVQRTVVPLDEISDNLQKAAIAIEDDKFYSHNGVRPLAIIRAFKANLEEGGITQGGSTITQQVVKNALLTREKSYTRKIKEAILALRLERQVSKDRILEIYLNESPYGGTIYGAEEAAQSFFDKPASDLTIAESAYLAALPQAPTYYSPYGENIDDLESRQNRVLTRMHELGYINDGELAAARAEEVGFQPRQEQGIKAPHFVFYVRSVLEQELGVDEVENGGLKVITTIDLDLQEEAEEIVKRYAERNLASFNAENAATVAIDAKTGQILTMVGSRDWFDDSFDGQFNAATALRQPGSTFKPFIYSTALDQGYTPETVVFDLPTQFNVNCPAQKLNNEDGCYAPVNYDDEYLGPMTFRNALAQSRNVPAVKAFYLAGLEDSAQTARNLGISTLDNVNQYGLTLVLGGGEVRLVDMVGAYAGFANDGRVNPHTPILEVTDYSGDTLLEYQNNQDRQVLPVQVARQMTDILSDNQARTPAFGPNSLLNITSADVAAKTGTTNNFRDAWTIGYTPEIVVGAWAGNNDNSPMVKRTAGFIITPIWHDVIQAAIEMGYGEGQFVQPEPEPNDLKPILRGVWRPDGDDSVHSILAWVNKESPRGPIPQNPSSDDQYNNWETSVRTWVQTGRSNLFGNFGSGGTPPSSTPLESNQLSFEISGLNSNYDIGDTISLEIVSDSDISTTALFIDGNLAGVTEGNSISIPLTADILGGGNSHELRVLATNTDGEVGEKTKIFQTSDTSLPESENESGLLNPTN